MKDIDTTFPLPEGCFPKHEENINGLTVRDYIAIQAMKSLLSSKADVLLSMTLEDQKLFYERIDQITNYSYGVADKMIEESEK